MRKRAPASIILIVLIAVAATWVFKGYWSPPPAHGFNITALQDDTLLVSDAQVLSFNATSQEFTLNNAASQKLMQMRDILYNYNYTVTLKIDGEEIYQGLFRAVWMSAVPSPPEIAILFPSFNFTDDTENSHAMRLFYPYFQPGSNQLEANQKLIHYFEATNRLTR